MADQFPFEKPIIELRNKISELKTFTLEKDIDLSGEIEKLEGRLEQLEEDIYGNMGAWDRVQIARHNNRP
ncbi:acetyl-CoA carboxylase subunit alpha, partial [Pseudomonas sp. 2588-5]